MASTISVCMIAKNEEQVIGDALKSAMDQVDEIVVVDTGSIDHTVDVARRLGAKVYEALWDNSFASMRNKSLEYATSDYVLVLDADERLPADSKSRLEKFVHDSPGFFGRVRIRSEFPGADNTPYFSISHVTRFFPRTVGIQYVGRIHEQVVDAQQKHGHLDTGLVISHIGYNFTYVRMREKSHRNLELLLLENDGNCTNGYYWYQIGKTYEALGDVNRGRECYALACKYGDSQATYYPELMVSYLYTLKKLHRQDEMWAVLSKALALYQDYPDLYFFTGRALMEFHTLNLENIRQSFEICLMLGERSTKYPSVKGVGTYLALYNLGVFYESIGDKVCAKTMYERSSTMGFKRTMDAFHRLLEG